MEGEDQVVNRGGQLGRGGRGCQRLAANWGRTSFSTCDAKVQRDAEHESAEASVVRDDPLRLIFTCCHPALPREGQVALTLRLLGGLSTREIAAAFLVSESTAAQRIVRAKRAIRDRRLPYRVPEADELALRLPAVLEVVYLIFNEGYAARDGETLVRRQLCEEAVRLAALLAELMPREPEVLGLFALLELQASRQDARADPDGALVLLEAQDRSRWDRVRIERARRTLARAFEAGPPGAYALQAAIALCHASAPRFEATDWRRIAALYAELVDVYGPPGAFAAAAIGYGAGTRDPAEGPPNLLRVQLGGSPRRAEPPAPVWLLEFNLDDATGEEVGFCLQELRAAGALEAWWAPVQMKKDRPGGVVTALCREPARPGLERVAFDHTPTLGLRWSPVERTECEREELAIELHGRRVRVVRRRRPGEGSALAAIDLSPEHDDLAALARETGRPLRELEREVVRRLLERPAP